jgi:hypothetical protein
MQFMKFISQTHSAAHSPCRSTTHMPHLESNNSFKMYLGSIFLFITIHIMKIASVNVRVPSPLSWADDLFRVRAPSPFPWADDLSSVHGADDFSNFDLNSVDNGDDSITFQASSVDNGASNADTMEEFQSVVSRDAGFVQALKESHIDTTDVHQVLAKAVQLGNWEIMVGLSKLKANAVLEAISTIPSTEQKLVVFRKYLEEIKYLGPEEYVKSDVFLAAAHIGDIDMIKVIMNESPLRDPENIVRYFGWLEESDSLRNQLINSPNVYLISGILQTLNGGISEVRTMNTLLSMIDDVSAENNMLLKLSALSGDTILIDTLLKDKRVINAGLEEAMESSLNRYVSGRIIGAGVEKAIADGNMDTLKKLLNLNQKRFPYGSPYLQYGIEKAALAGRFDLVAALGRLGTPMNEQKAFEILVSRDQSLVKALHKSGITLTVFNMPAVIKKCLQLKNWNAILSLSSLKPQLVIEAISHIPSADVKIAMMKRFFEKFQVLKAITDIDPLFASVQSAARKGDIEMLKILDGIRTTYTLEPIDFFKYYSWITPGLKESLKLQRINYTPKDSFLIVGIIEAAINRKYEAVKELLLLMDDFHSVKSLLFEIADLMKTQYRSSGHYLEQIIDRFQLVVNE